MTEAKRIRLEAEYANAVLDEKRAREAHDQRAADAAEAQMVSAQDGLFALQEAVRTNADEERVALLSPNPDANVVDANGIEFVVGRAEGVGRSLARRYVADFPGYAIEED